MTPPYLPSSNDASPLGRGGGPKKGLHFSNGEPPLAGLPLIWAHRRRQIMSIGLTATAGFIDAVCYMVLFHIYTANMSGNTITFGTNAAYGQWRTASRAALPIACFVAGLCLCTFLMEWMTRAGWKRRLAVILGLEAACLATFLMIGACTLGWSYPGRLPNFSIFTFLTILAAGAMGLQNASLTHVGSLTVTTTHVTGTLLKFAEGFMHYLFWLYDHTLGRFPRRWTTVLRISPRKRAWQAAGLMGLLWISYLVGAICGAIWLDHWGLSAIAGPLIMIGAFILLDLLWPAAVTGLRPFRASYADAVRH